MARLYANENFPLPVVVELRRLGHDVLTIHEIGKAGQSVSDEAVLAFASSDSRAVLTLNRKHFIRLHTLNQSTGVLSCVHLSRTLSVRPVESMRLSQRKPSFPVNSSGSIVSRSRT